jgi:hypothetical protein
MINYDTFPVASSTINDNLIDGRASGFRPEDVEPTTNESLSKNGAFHL